MIGFGAIDDANGFVYFTASPDNALQQYLYKVSLKGDGKAELVSSAEQKGTHTYQISPTGLYAKHSFSNITTPPTNEWVNLSNKTVLVLLKKAHHVLQKLVLE